MWKANKVPDEDLAPSTLGHRRPFEYQRVPHLGLSLLRILEAGTSKYTWRASMPQMGIQPENERRRIDHKGETSPVTGPSSIVQKGLLYPFFLYIEING